MITTIRSKSFLFVGIFAVCFLLQAVSQYLHNEKLRSEAVYLAGTQTKILASLHDLQIATIQIQQWLTDISATRGLDGLNDGLDEAAKSANQFRQAVKRLRKLDADSGIAYEDLLPIMEDYYQTGQKMARQYIQGGAAAGNQLMGDFDATAVAIYDRVETISRSINENADVRFAHQLMETSRAQTLNLAFSGMYLFLLIGILWGVTRYVLRPVQQMVHMTHDLAHGEGDLTQRLVIRGDNELTVLGKNFNAFIQRTDVMMSEMMKTIVRLVPMSKEISSTNQKIEQASKGQQTYSQQVSDHMQSTQDSANAVASRSEEIAVSVKKSSRILGESQKIASETRHSIDSLSSEIALMSEAIAGLRDNSDKIGSIIDVINSISEQTNLLALNAAIEAARAGEAGRGFAVVADEVRTLASRTKDATVEVQAMITSIQNGTHQVESTMKKGIHSTQTSVEKVNTSAEHLNDLAQAIDQINQQANDIKAEIDGQNGHFMTVSHSIELMESEFRNTLQYLEENLHFGGDLKNLSDKLRDMASRFKVTDTNYSEHKRSLNRNLGGSK